jgi:5'-nucleotidase / UDP-sugar diphosphatase
MVVPFLVYTSNTLKTTRMKRIILTLIVPVMAANILSAQDPEIIILHTNDTHGRIFPVVIETDNATSQMADEGAEKMMKPERHGEIGGFASLATAVKEVRQEYGDDHVLLIDGGDAFSDGLLSQLTKGEANIRLMNLLGYDFMALGNHDFDFKKDRTKELDRMANFPLRGLNVIDSATGRPFPGEPYIIKEKGHIQIGLLALAYRNTHLTTSKKNIQGLRFEESSKNIGKYLAELKEKADLIVVVSHEGLEYDKELAKKTEGIDIIIGGHSHDVTEKPEKVKNTWIVQAFSHGMALGITKVKLKDKQIKNVETEVRWLWTDEVQPDGEMAQAVEEISEPHHKELYEVIGHTNTAIPRNYKSGSPFDYLVGEILMEKTGSVAAMLPGVGYGITINAGDIRRLDLHALLPHDSKLATVELQGTQIIKILEKSAENQKPEDIANSVGGIIQTPGIEWKADLSKPIGERVSDIKIDGHEIENEKWYKIATHGGMLEGLHGYDEIGRGRSINKTEEEIARLVERYFSDKNEISVPNPNISVK